MKLHCLGSSSKGNSYLLQGKNDSLVIDAGINIIELKKALNFDLSKVSGCIADHFHGDHIKYFKDYLKAGINVHIEKQSIPYLKGFESQRIKIFEEMKDFQVGSFKIKAFPVIHDIPTVGFLIEQPEMGRMVFITDTKFLNFHFPGMNHIVVEANYSIDIMNERLISGSIDGYLRNRIMESHLEFGVTKEFLLANDLRKVRTITLTHLSDSNSDADRFQRETEEITGKPVFIADAGKTIDLSLDVF